MCTGSCVTWNKSYQGWDLQHLILMIRQRSSEPNKEERLPWLGEEKASKGSDLYSPCQPWAGDRELVTTTWQEK